LIHAAFASDLSVPPACPAPPLDAPLTPEEHARLAVQARQLFQLLVQSFAMAFEMPIAATLKTECREILLSLRSLRDSFAYLGGWAIFDIFLF
jgi:hypothetical protein